MLGGACALDVIVHHGGDVELEHVAQVFDLGIVITVVDGALDFIIHLDNLLVRDGQVVFAPH